MGGFHILKIIHLVSIVFWSTFVCFFLSERKAKWIHWVLYVGAFMVTSMSGVLLLNTVAIRFETEYPAWVFIKYGLTLALFITGALSLKKKWLKAHWYYVLIYLLLITTTIVSIMKPYL